MPCLTTQSKDNRNRGIHIHRLTVEQGGFVTPLTDGVHRVLHQQRRTGDVSQLLDRAVLGNNCVEDDRAGNVSRLGNRRINRLHLANQVCCCHVAANSNARGRCLRRRGQSRARSTDNTAKNAASLTARNATGDATHNTRSTNVRRQFFFLDHLHFLGDDGGSQHLAIVNQALHRLHHSLHGRGGRRWRGRRRRWNQKRREHLLGQGFRIDERNQNQDAQQTSLNHG